MLPSAVVCLLALVGTFLPLNHQAYADDPELQTISEGEGYVLWGIKQSWRRYIGLGGTSFSDGVERVYGSDCSTLDDYGDDKKNCFGTETYRWPVKSGTYDPSTRSLDLQLSGVAHFEAYCTNGTACLLDSTFKDLRLTITPEKQVISGTYVGIPRENPGGEFEEYHIDLVNLNIRDSNPATYGAVTYWEGITSVASDKNPLYAPGSVFDDVSIAVSGEIAKPELSQEFSEQGTPVYRYTENSWTGKGSIYESSMVASPEHNAIIEYNANEDESESGVLSSNSVTLLDGDTLAVRGAVRQQRSADVTPGRNLVVDPKGLRAFFLEMPANLNDQKTQTIKYFEWDETTSSFTTHELDTIDLSDTSRLIAYWLWNSESDELWVLHSYKETDTSPLGIQLITYRYENGSWVKNTFAIPEPENSYLGDETIAHSWSRGAFGIAINGVFLNSTDVVLPISYCYNNRLPVVRLTKSDATSYQMSFIDKTLLWEVPFDEDAKWPPCTFTEAEKMPDGRIIFSDAAQTSSFMTWDPATGDTENFTVTEEKDLDKFTDVAVDMESNRIFIAKTSVARAKIFDGKGYIGEIHILTDENQEPYITGLEVLKPGTLYSLAARTSDTQVQIRKYQYAGTTPVVTQDPQNAEVEIAADATSTAAQFSVAGESDLETSVRWQVKAPGAKEFVDVEGATSHTLSVDATEADNGAVYRAVLTNDVGAVLSAEATLTVTQAAAQPTPVQPTETPSATPTTPASTPATPVATETPAATQTPEPTSSVVAVPKQRPTGLPATGLGGFAIAGLAAAAVVACTGIGLARQKKPS